MKKCVIYSRVSSVNGSQEFQSQNEDLELYARQNGFEVVCKPFGEKVSGFDQNVERIEFEKMKSYVIQNDIKHILIWEVSRLARTTLKSLQEIDYFKQNGVNIYFKKENVNTLKTDASSKLLLDILASIAEIERSNIVERFSRGRTSSVLKGKRAGYCFLPYGFSVTIPKDKDDKNSGYLIINETEANVVRDIYDMYVNGKSMRSIAIELNSKNILTRHAGLGKTGKTKTGQTYKILWRNNSIITILKNRLYKGERNYKGNIVAVPQIVDTKIWDKVQEMLKNNTGYKLRTKYQYLFKTKLFCGHCGYMMGTRTETRYKNPSSFYFCTGHSNLSLKCKAGQFTSKFIDDKIYNQIFKDGVFFHISMYEEHKKVFNVNERLEQIEYFKNEIPKEEARKKRSIKLYKDDLITEKELEQDQLSINNKIREYENNIKKIEREIDNYQDFDLKRTLATLTNETNFNIKYEFIQKYVDKVVIYKVNKCEIDFSKLTYSDYWREGETQLKNPNGRDKLLYVEIFSFGNPEPLKVVLTNHSQICYISKKLNYISDSRELFLIN